MHVEELTQCEAKITVLYIYIYESFAPVNNSTLALLREKHPPPHTYSEVPPQPTNSIPLEIFTPTVLSVIQSFPAGSAAGSAAGPDGLRPQHLRSGLGSNLLSQALTHFVNFVINGEILVDARPFFFGASLKPLWWHCPSQGVV